MKTLALGLMVILTSCASIVEGTDQTIGFNVTPETATCNVLQKGRTIGTLQNGGGQLNVSKSRKDLRIECVAPGYKKQVINMESSASGWGIVGCFLIDLCITDYATGALNKYDKAMTITLAKDTTTTGASNRTAFQPLQASSSPPGQTSPTAKWQTAHADVKAYWGTSLKKDFLLLPTSFALTLIKTSAQWGLFEMTETSGSRRQVWIALSDVAQAS
jgi:hypothetical protein